MGTRKTVYGRNNLEMCRDKIKTSQLLNRLQKIALAEIDATPVSLKALEIALRKTCPDLQSIEHVGETQAFVIQAPVQLDATDWAAKYASPIGQALDKPKLSH